jgi:molybdate transport system substrate-binding protein
MKSGLSTGVAVLCFLAAAGSSRVAGGAGVVEINLYAAASLREALQELAPRCAKMAAVEVVLNFGSSSDLARQIEAAEKADLFFSADEAIMDRLASARLVAEGSRRSVLSNRLVVVGAADSRLAVRSAADLSGSSVRRLSLANPEAVPAGKYAKAWLEKAGVWAGVKDRIVPGVDVRAALAAVESGSVDAGVVYGTDAAISKKVRVLYAVPVDQSPTISYPLALLRGRPNAAAAVQVEDCLTGTAAMDVYRAHGFITGPRQP